MHQRAHDCSVGQVSFSLVMLAIALWLGFYTYKAIENGEVIVSGI
jgi:hypothetical protein